MLVDESQQVRKQMLTNIAASDPELAGLIEGLLQGDDMGILFPESALEAIHRDNNQRAQNWCGKVIGVYRVQELIAQGGMSDVYLGERTDGEFNRQVAIKIGRQPSRSTRPERHRRERQILSDLTSPHIALMLDGGTTGGYPYVIMEYVQGISIRDYCARHQLSFNQRIDLFLQVCDAVQFAHANLIIHADLKPSNILVTDEGRVKLIDFGIAQLMETQNLDEERALSWAYASPEQRAGQRMTVASDIYSLAVVLFELLTGRRPADDDGPDKDASSVAFPNGLPSQSVRAILKKALEPEANRRYPSLELMRTDLKRTLEKRSISIASTSGWDELILLFLRNPKRALITGATLLTLACLLAFSMFQTSRLRQQQARSRVLMAETESVNEALIDSFRIARQAKGGSISALEVLASGKSYAESLGQQPRHQATLLASLGKIYAEFGQYNEAADCLDRAINLSSQIDGNRRSKRGELMLDRAQVHFAQAQYNQVHELLESLRTGTSDTLSVDLGARLACLYAATEIRRGNINEAKRIIQENVQHIKGKLEPSHPAVVQSLLGLAGVLRESGQVQESVATAKQALDMLSRLDGQVGEMTRISAHGELADVLVQAGNNAQAKEHIQIALSSGRTFLDKHHPYLGTLLTIAADINDRDGDFGNAEMNLREALNIRRATLGEAHPDVAVTLNNLAVNRYRVGDYAQSETLFAEALAIRESCFPAGHPELALAINNVAGVKQVRGDFQSANELYKQALSINQNAYGPKNPMVATNLHNLGWVARNLSQFEEAERYYLDSLEMRRALLGADHPMTALSMHSLGWLYRSLDRNKEAENLLSEALKIRIQKLGEKHPQVGDSKAQLAEIYRLGGRLEQAATLAKEALALYREVLPPDHWQVANTQSICAAIARDLMQPGSEEGLELSHELLVRVLGRDAVATREAQARLTIER